MKLDIKYTDLKTEERTFEPLNGVYLLQAVDVLEKTNDDGSTTLVFTHDILNLNRKVSYDNYKITNENGEPNTFGRRKLGKLIDATKTKVESITMTVLTNFVIGSVFKALLETNERGYPQIRYDEIYPKDDMREALNENVINNPTTKGTKEKAATPMIDVDDTDI